MGSEKSNFFYFTAQTGVIVEEPSEAPSNFYTYRLATKHRVHVERELERAAKDMQKFNVSELVYSKAFLLWLEEHEVKDERNKG